MVVNQVIFFINDVIYLHACECQTLQRHFYFICYSPSDCCDDDDAKYCYFFVTHEVDLLIEFEGFLNSTPKAPPPEF